jgi:hypothetical protein
LHLHRLVAGGAVVALLTGTAACGAQAAEPKIALRDAASAWAANRTGALELSIASSSEDVLAFAEAADPSSDVESAVPEEDLDTLLASSFELAYDLGEDRDSDADDLMRLVVNVGDLEAGELRSVDGLLYGRVDVDGLAERFPDMQQGIDEFRAGLTGGDGVSAPAPASVVEPATALLDGEWISVDIQAYLDLMEEQFAAAGGDPADMSTSAETQAKARELFGSALKSAVASVERREGDDELGDHLVASIDLRKAYTKIRTGLPELMGSGMGDSAEEQLPPVEEVPDKQIDVSFWVRDGELSRVELDFAQFLEKPAGHLVLRADVQPEQEITAPSDAVPFDFEALAAEMPVGYEGEGAGEPAMEMDAHTIATWIDADIFAHASEDGATPSVSYLQAVLPGYEGVVEGLVVTAVGERIQVAVGPDVVCLTPSAQGFGENIVPGPC